MEPEFPLFVNPKKCISIFEEDSRFNFDDILYFCNNVHYSGNFCFDINEYPTVASDISPKILKRLEDNFIFKDNKIYLRGNNYYLGGRSLLPPQKIDLMCENIHNLNELLSDAIPEAHADNIQKAVIFSSIYDHLKHYLMIIFNGLYRKHIHEKNGDDDLIQVMRLCDLYTHFYYKNILQNQLSTYKIDDNFIELIQKKTLLKYLSDEIDFYREMDNPQRILLHTCSITKNAKKEYNVVVNPLSGATELGFALKSISLQVGKKVVKNILPIQYSFYQNGEREVVNFPSLIENTFARPMLKLLPKNADDPILISDDNVSGGGTLLILQNIFMEKYLEVDVTAVEARTLYYKEFDEKDSRTPEEVMQILTFKPIGETRRNLAVNRFINQYLLTQR